MGTYTIGEVSARSGFPATTLRYYEDIGLVVPAARTAAGYRIYDDGALDRLAFVARAKQAGCTLEEVADLVELWDGGRCGPVQRREAATRLEGPAVDGPCDAACACGAVQLVARS
jgi:DNA-binding transcriptional MerR regulator